MRCRNWAHAGVGEGRVSSLSRGLGEGQREDKGKKGKRQPCSVSAGLTQSQFLRRGCGGGGEDNRGYGMPSSITQLPATRACRVSPGDPKGERDSPAHPCYPGANSGP